ncbi:PIN domain-containing protein [Microbacterium sp. NPDC091382]|uniref:PIN domain-containing protein n=1 Tax=Microbacterium sp. NPDC091382 TaxID=3364210 RepID=UPI0038084F28
MVNLLPGVRANIAAQQISAARQEAGDLLTSGRLFANPVSLYTEWVYRQVAALRDTLDDGDIRAIFLTHEFDLARVQTDLGQRSTHDAVDHAIRTTVQHLDAAYTSVEAARGLWRDKQVVVLDTNVLLRHSAELVEIKWAGRLNWDPDEPITLGVPLVVVSELDSLKLSNSSHVAADGTKQPQRMLARNALRRLSELFPGSHLRDNDVVDGRLSAVLMMDDLRHIRLPSNDAAIVDRALAVLPYVEKVAVASYDLSLRFLAEKLGLATLVPTDAD